MLIMVILSGAHLSFALHFEEFSVVFLKYILVKYSSDQNEVFYDELIG